MELNKRKELELKIISHLENKPQLEAVLTECWASGLFTKEEMTTIVNGSKLYAVDAEKNIEKIERFTTIARKIGPSSSFVLLNLIKQFPTMQNKEGYFVPDRKSICKNSKVTEQQLILILSELRKADLISTIIHSKKMCVKLNWEIIQEMSESNDISE